MITTNEVLRRVLLVLIFAGAATFAMGIGYIVPERPTMALAGAFAVLVFGAAVAQPALLPVAAMPLLVVVLRVGGGGVDLTVSDFVLGLVFWPALILSPKPFSRELRYLLWLNVVYQAATLLTVVANPYLANVVEWFHAWLLVSGALIVGWAVGRAGFGKIGLTLFLLACVALAIPTVAEGALQWASGDFSEVYPKYPWSMHKNFIGTLLCFAAILAYAHPTWMGWSGRWAMSAFWLFAVGIAMSQSRQALLALGVALLVVSFRKPGEKRRSILAILAIIPTGYFVATLIRDQIASGNVHNSVFQRLNWFGDTIALWERSPLLGHGLRYWTTGRTEERFQPPNAFLEVLASTGIVGIAAFVMLFGGMLVVLWRLDPDYGTVAFALVLARLVQSQFDLFWIAITVSVPLVVSGIAIGALAHRETNSPIATNKSAGTTMSIGSVA
ncbi:O-antigen ligase family protein [Ornithinimicrobium sp. F0845]|uniref:O-antigen ligase family protein n=1 Tax=Ornithinimicrobium sp. F0845 TaxID=2926412 RepID=UPI001FF4164A|nr:O-antigen ligase family protein [Ornithinimicrobium sp. F0845]MCK0110538.1 O-antigen ligase family protein [Ornithinimicrobium sp. F0845]